MKLAGKRVLVTGATGGIGGALATALAEGGAQVIAHGRDEGRLAGFRERGLECVSEDLSAPEGPARLAAAVLASGPVDVLINNAAIQEFIDLTQVTGDAAPQRALIDRELELNLRAPIHLACLLLPTLLRRPESAIVNVTSGLALMPKQSAPTYCATKAALHSFSLSLRWQLEGTSVRVFEALPPLVDTEMTRGRGRGKITAGQCAQRIIDALEADETTILVGKSRWLAVLARLLPSLAQRLMRRS